MPLDLRRERAWPKKVTKVTRGNREIQPEQRLTTAVTFVTLLPRNTPLCAHTHAHDHIILFGNKGNKGNKAENSQSDQRVTLLPRCYLFGAGGNSPANRPAQHPRQAPAVPA